MDIALIRLALPGLKRRHRTRHQGATWAGDLQKPPLLAWFLLAVALTTPHPAIGWGDEGHKVIALFAENYLEPAVRSKVATLLAADTDPLTDHDIESEATWADKYRDSDRDAAKIRYKATRQWHFVDIELAQPDLALSLFRPSAAPCRGPGLPRAATGLRGRQD